MSDSVLIKNAHLKDPAKGLNKAGDVYLENGTIAAIDGPGKISKTAATTIDANGAWLLPGFFDAHVHFREPGFEYKETIATGTRVAAAGGFTDVACMANTKPVNDSASITAMIVAKAREAGGSRVHPIGAITKGLMGEELANIGSMKNHGIVGISDDGKAVMNSFVMRKAMEYASGFDLPVITHCEDHNLVAGGAMNEGRVSTLLGLPGNPNAAEEIMVARDISLCRLTGARLHIAHVSTRESLVHIERAKNDGLPVSAEVCPHHLLLDEEAILGYDTSCKMAPPLRTGKDVEAVSEALSKGIIDIIATDHAPHGLIDKNVEFDCAQNGIIGLQTAISSTFELVRKDVLTEDRWIESLTSKPRSILGLEPLSIQQGAPADLVLFDPKSRWTYEQSTNLSKSSNSPFLGREFLGTVERTIVSGRVVYERK